MKLAIASGVLATSALVTSANADFRGFVAFVRSDGPNTVIDVFLGVGNPSDRLLNCYNRSISTSATEGFVHLPGAATRGWKPDVGSNSRSTSNDSFMTIGVSGGAPYAGQFYASGATGADGNFTNWTTAGATTVPANAGWFISPPTEPDNIAESLSTMAGARVNLSGGATAAHGVWCAHLVVANTATSFTVQFGGQATIKDGLTGASVQSSSSGTITIDGDRDDDGIPDAVDGCPDASGPASCNGCPLNPCGGCGSTAPDADGDGRLDCQDNCPNVPNPTQADCDNDGIGDACDAAVDCNANGVQDNCDILAGTSTDANGDGIPDECQPGFKGFVGFVRRIGTNTVIDVFAAVANPSDRLLNCFNRSISTNLPAGFVQAPGTATRGWRPDLNTNSRNNGIDSFMTIGVEGGALIGGQAFASNATTADGNFANWTANGAVAVPPNAGWFISPPVLPDNAAEPLASIAGSRVNLSGSTGGATHGVWCAHLVLSNSANAFTVNFGGQASIRAGSSSNTFQGSSSGVFAIDGDLDDDGTPDALDGCPDVAGPCAGCPANVCGSCGNPPDTDGDGRIDCQDNCPTVANASQADCDGDGQGDACEGIPDCNSNGRPDNCDVASGSSLDVDSNGVPDECQPDCNGNNVPDRYDIATGAVSDLNADGVPDTCQGAVMVATSSGNVGAPSGGQSRSFTFTGLRYAETSVTVTVDARGDLDNNTEWIDVAFDGTVPTRLFANTGSLCPATPNRATITLTRSQFNAIAAPEGSVTVTLTCPPTVDATECRGNALMEVSLRYVGIDPESGDCNGNQRLDIVETYEGSVADCNGNKVPDSCDIARGVGTDCNANGAIDACELAATPSLDCNGNGVIDGCDIAAGGTAVDCDGNGRLDTCQVIENPAQDCNSNGRPDTCDLSSGGAAVDCDGNGRLDACQVLENPTQDCNSNGKPDGCDIAAGISADIDGNGKPDECQTVTVPGSFATIQAAIDAAPTNEMRIISVAAGTYAGPIAFNGKPVRVRGAHSSQTFIQGNGGQTLSVVRFTGGEPAIAMLEGVTVRGGNSGSPIPSNPAVLVGGGVFGLDSAAGMRNCVVEGNSAGFGGGAYFLRCSGSVSNCTFRGNSSSADGGGFQSNQGTQVLTDVLVQNNVANSRGGGMHLVLGTPVLTRVQVTGNQCSNIMGGISWFASGSPAAALQLNDCTVSGNTAAISYGGIGITENAAPTVSMRDSTACGNLPRPNVFGNYTDLGGNTVCDCEGDLNLDGTVNGFDLGLLLAVWGPCAGACPADLNGDGAVSGFDLGLLLAQWGFCGN